VSRRRFYAQPESFPHAAGQLTLSEEESRHLRDVLRLRAGDEAQVFDGEGREFLCVVVEPGGRRDAARLEVRERVEPPSPESTLALTLAVALLKGEKFDLVVQKATELGAARVIPVETKRADVRLRDARDTAKRVERWRRLALEAAKQSGRARVPGVEDPVSLVQLVEAAPRTDEARVLFAEGGGAPLSSLLTTTAERPSSITALVGPEGGWEHEEIELARTHGWQVVTLGGRILRAETAAITVCALLQHLYGDLK
jgi:16S rRNA (uracil1498-N3)-methyltransferase